MTCGAPLIPCVGIVDSMRIGPDTIIPQLDKIPLVSSVINTRKIKTATKCIKNKRKTNSKVKDIRTKIYLTIKVSNSQIVNINKSRL